MDYETGKNFENMNTFMEDMNRRLLDVEKKLDLNQPEKKVIKRVD